MTYGLYKCYIIYPIEYIMRYICIHDIHKVYLQALKASEANEKLMEAVRSLENDLPVEPIASVVIAAMLDVGGQELYKVQVYWSYDRLNHYIHIYI